MAELTMEKWLKQQNNKNNNNNNSINSNKRINDNEVCVSLCEYESEHSMNELKTNIKQYHCRNDHNYEMITNDYSKNEQITE